MNKLTHSHLQGANEAGLLESSIGVAFDATTERFPDNPGLVVRHQQISWSYREYREQVDRLAVGLQNIGIGKGDCVGLWAPNCYQWSLTQFATAKIGAIMVCINPAYRLHELEYALNKSECKALVTAANFKTSDYLAMLEDLAPELAQCVPGELQAKRLPCLSTIIQMNDAEQRAGMFCFSEVMATLTDADRKQLKDTTASLEQHEPINIQFTSGTTGNPKGATLSHHNILNNAAMVARVMQLTEKDKLCIPVPLYHCFGMVLGNLVCITSGAGAVFPNDAFDPMTTLAAVSEEKCTALHGVPTMFIAELDCPKFADYDLSSLRTGIMAGSPCPIETMKRVIAEMNMSEVLIGYGQTECSPINHITKPDDPLEKRVGTVGRPVSNQEIKIVDEQGSVVPVGEKGEICCRGYNVMIGYWNDEERTAETVDKDGWLYSGDIGIMDEEGYVQVVGRIKDMIIRGGENIYPAEVEQFLYTHPDIQEIQVVGVPDAKYGEQVCAWIQTRAQNQLTADQVRAFCDGQIAHYKIPHYIKFVDEYPMTITGKIQKFIMREQMIAELEQELELRKSTQS